MFWLWWGCSFGKFEHQTCDQNTDCLAAFGRGHQCTNQGLCEQVSDWGSCNQSYPANIKDDLQDYEKDYFIGSIIHTQQAEPEIAAIDLAIQSARDKASLGTHNFAVIHCDYEPQDAEQSIAESTAFLTEVLGISVMIGPSDASGSILVTDSLKDKNTVLLAPTPADPQHLASSSSKSDEQPGLVWNLLPSIQTQAAVLVQKLNQNNAQSLIVITDSSDYANMFLETLQSIFPASISHYSYASIEENIWQQAASSEPVIRDTVFIAEDANDSMIFLQSISSEAPDYVNTNIYLTDKAYQKSLPDQLLSPYTSNIFGTRLLTPASPILSTLYQELQESTGVDGCTHPTTSYVYDASWLAIYGLTWSHYQESKTTGETVARGIRQTTHQDQSQIVLGSAGWSSVLFHFSNGNAINIEGSSGALDFDLDTEQLNGPIALWSLDNATHRLADDEICSTAACWPATASPCD